MAKIAVYLPVGLNHPEFEVILSRCQLILDKKIKLDIILNAIKMVKGDLNISWLSVDKAKMEGTFVSFPERDEIDLTMNEQLVVEYYSR